MSAAKPAFQRLQYRFAAHLRDPRKPAPAGIEPRRLRIYEELFYNNVQGFLANAFPVLRRITPETRWHALVRDFFARHQSPQPLFHGIAAEFLQYLERERRPATADPPFLLELAHYEWVELALDTADVALPPVDEDGDLLAGVPVASPLAWPLTYRFPVHRIGPGYLPSAPPAEPTHLVVYRNRQDQVKFMLANAVTARLLRLAGRRRDTGAQLLRRIARELKAPPEPVLAQGLQTLQALRERDIILGTRRTAARGSKIARKRP